MMGGTSLPTGRQVGGKWVTSGVAHLGLPGLERSLVRVTNLTFQGRGEASGSACKTRF